MYNFLYFIFHILKIFYILFPYGRKSYLTQEVAFAIDFYSCRHLFNNNQKIIYLCVIKN